MSNLINFIRDKKEEFTVFYPKVKDIEQLIKDELFSNFEAFEDYETLSYNYVGFGNKIKVDFTLSYYNQDSELNFIVRNKTELAMAIAIILKSHRSSVKIIVDNRTGFIDINNPYDIIKEFEKQSGIEFELSQKTYTLYNAKYKYGGKVIIYKIEYTYFDDYKKVNDLMCNVADHSIITMKNNKTDVEILEYLMNWFRNHIEYKNNNLDSDHSAVGLVKNGTAVCQGIATYAYMFLINCGIKARYVRGEGFGGKGEWGSHGWNLVYINGKWQHIDYTFELSSARPTIFVPFEEFKSIHKWDNDVYSDEYSEKVTKAAEKLRFLEIAIYPDSRIFSVNGCKMYIPSIKNISPVIDGEKMLALLDIIVFIGGSYKIANDDVKIYFGNKKYFIFKKSLTLKDDTYYIPVSRLYEFGFRVSLSNTETIIRR